MGIKLVNKATGELFDIDYFKLKQVQRNRVRVGIMAAARERKLRHFVTLTINRRLIPGDSCPVCCLKRFWELLLKRWRRRCENLSFICVVECGGRGFYHLHVLADCILPKELSAAWLEFSGGTVKQSEVPESQIPFVVHYVCKELKNAHSHVRGKVVSTSRNISLADFYRRAAKRADAEFIRLDNPPRKEQSNDGYCVHGYAKAKTIAFLAIFEPEITRIFSKNLENREEIASFGCSMIQTRCSFSSSQSQNAVSQGDFTS